MRKFNFLVFVFLVVWGVSGGVKAEGDKEKEAWAAIERILPPIITTWNAEELIINLHPEVLSSTSREALAQSFFLFKTLGRLSTYNVCVTNISEQNVSVFKKIWIVTASVDAVFENAPARIDLCLIGDGDRWFISRFFVDSSYFRESRPAPQELTKEELEPLVKELLKQDEVLRTRQIDKIYRLAEIYEKDGRTEEAINLYEQALKTDSSNVYYQNKLAKLLFACGRIGEGGPRLQFVYQFAEDDETIVIAGKLLSEQRIEIPKCEKLAGSLLTNSVVALVPVGSPSPLVIEELRSLLERNLGVPVCILSDPVLLGAVDKLYADQFISGLYSNIASGLTDLQQDQVRKKMGYIKGPIATTDMQRRFIEIYLSVTGKSQDLERFRQQIKEMGSSGKYSIEPVAGKIRNRYPFDARRDIKAYIGVTEQDIYSGSANFCYGGTVGAYGVISYHCFASTFTGETQNRPRMINRLLKQAISSTCFIFFGPRCSQPYCVRTYPKTLEQHDQKSDQLCAGCQHQLAAYTENPWSESIECEYLNIGNELYKQQDFEKAYRSLSIALEQNPSSMKVNELFGATCYMSSRTNEAEKALLKATQNGAGSAFVHEILGRMQFTQSRYAEAVAHLLQAGDSLEIKEMLGLSYWNSGEYAKAMPVLKEVTTHHPTANTCFAYGWGLRENGQIAEALTYLEKAVELCPDHALAHHQIGVAYAQFGQNGKAREYFEKYAAISPEQGDPWNDLGYFYYQQGGYSKSMEYYRKALQCDPKSGLIHYNVALLCYQTGAYSLAWEYYQNAVNKGYPGSPEFKKILENTLRKSP